MSYEKLSTVDEGIDEPESKIASYDIDGGMEEFGLDDNKDGDIIQTRNERPFPISRPPAQHRDKVYAVIFLLHFVAILLLSLIEQNSLNNAIVNYGKAGSWASMMMIVTLLGSFFGSVMSFVLVQPAYREAFLGFGISFSLILKICIGNVLLIMRSNLSFLGVLVIISAIIDSFSYKTARENICVTSALIQMVVDTTKLYGIGFFVTCAFIVFAQTCILLWWGAFFIGLISTVPPGYVEALILIMMFSLYWITQFFHSLVSFVIGGCTIWIFAKNDDEILDPTSKLLLYLQCALTTSFGSLCKGALYVPFAQYILWLHHCAKSSHNTIPNRCNWKNVILCFTNPIINSVIKYNKLTFCQLATYGRTFRKTADDHISEHPETIDISLEDTTYFTLNSSSIEIAGIIATLFALLAEKKEGSSWPLFFFICFYLTYCGVSLTVQIYSASVDALIVSSALNPIRFAKENQIIFLKFLRTSETALHH